MAEIIREAKTDILLELEGITKSFAGIKALDDVSLTIRRGSVHGLIGANGAGKSTLIKVLAGAEMPDGGEIRMDGEPVKILNPRKSAAVGLSFIHQELSLIEHFNILENITLGMPKPTRLGLIDWQKIADDVRKVTDRINLKVPLTTSVKELSVAEQWMVSIARALYQNAKMIAMDEPTASLSESEVETLFGVIRDITANHGIAVIYVSHRLDEIMEICDEITVMRDGRKVLHSAVAHMSKAEIIDTIAGFHVAAPSGRKVRERAFASGRPLLEVDGIGDGKKVKDVSFRLEQGEILGLTGLVGSGRTELARLIFGESRPARGSMRYKEEPFAPRRPAEAIRKGVVLIPEERRTEGLVLGKSVNFNLNLPNLNLTRIVEWLPVVNPSKAGKISDEIIRKLRIKTNTAEAPILSLSGGNQQKVVIGKWLQSAPELVIMDEPTNGVDVGARSEIYQIIKEMADNGTSFLIISSDIEELPGLCDRVLVMVEGEVSGQLAGEDIRKENILKLCYTSPQSV